MPEGVKRKPREPKKSTITAEIEAHAPWLALAYGKARADRAIRWVEAHCRVPEGRLIGRPVKLTVKQKKWVRMIYGSRTRRFILSMARKNAKTAFTAFLLLLHLCGPEARPNSQLYSSAQSKEQAALLFALAAKVVRMSPDLGGVINIKDTNKEMVCPELGSVYSALSADAKTKFGMSPCFLVHDELGQVRGPTFDLYESLETACAAHDNPLSIIISTQAATDADLLSLLIDEALAEADTLKKTNPKAHPKTKVVLYTAPMDMDPFSEEAIRAANPHFDDFMNKEEVLDQAESARRMPSRENSYRNLILNQRVEAQTPFISRAIWLENGTEPDPLEGEEVWGGLDLSSVSDLTALVLCGKNGDVKPTFWLPRDGLERKSAQDRVPYDVWAKQGFLQTTPGRSIEYEFVAQYLRDVFDSHIVRGIAFDRWNMRHLKPWLERAGFSPEELELFKPFGQGFGDMSPAVRELESRLLQKKLRHGAHPVLTMCAQNAITVSDPAGNRKFTKQKASGRIDGMVALAMSLGCMPDVTEPPPQYRMIII